MHPSAMHGFAIIVFIFAIVALAATLMAYQSTHVAGRQQDLPMPAVRAH